MPKGLPFNEFVIKIYERCNLACKYCYMYEMADQSWRERDIKMPAYTFERVARRIAEHVTTHRLKEIDVVFHGGEPLLRGPDFIDWASKHLRELLNDVQVEMRIQTNGTLLNSETIDVLNDNNIQVGISLDGNREANDRYRLGHKGTSSFEATVAGIKAITQPEYRHLFRGIYSVIDLCNDPLETYSFLRSFDPPMLDFLLPYYNWENPPHIPLGSFESYNSWLIKVFDSWFSVVDQTTQIRLFYNIILGIMGGRSTVSNIGISPSTTAFIDTDGSITQLDSLKSAYQGAPDTGLNVIDNSFDEASLHPGFQARQHGIANLSKQCQKCNIVTICGGGDYPHRYHPKSGFNNPSVYCNDLQSLIRHIKMQVSQTIRSEDKENYEAGFFTY